MSAMDTKPTRLTQMVKKGGCAAKLPASTLRHVLAALKLNSPKELIVGSQTFDDAALFDLGDGRTLIQTVDFFTPIVDDPYDFGAIAAANALSDVFAMGGTASTALTILGFPAATLDVSLIEPLMTGALDRIHAAGACLAGGHSIENDALLLGFSVAGFVNRDQAWLNSGARPGDHLILTKGIGTGTITSALKLDKAQDDWVHGAVKSMTLLNASADLLVGLNIHSATDITGFSLAGHAMQMANASQVSLEIDTSAVPVLAGALACIGAGVLNRAHHTNLDYVRNHVDLSQIDDATKWLMVDPQTSGGLLFAVAADISQQVVDRLQPRFPDVKMIGVVEPADSTSVRFR